MLRMAQEAFTFDDVLLQPNYSEITPAEVSLVTQVTRRLRLNIPLLSAAMDTVTEARLAIAIAQEGGLGIIHKNMSIQQQASEVRKVKKFESVIVKDAITIRSDMPIKQVQQLANEYGFSSFPVVDKDQLVGILTSRDMRFLPAQALTVAEIMTPKARLIVVDSQASLTEIKHKLQAHRIEKIPVVEQGQLIGLVTVRDIEKVKFYPLATKDNDGRLLVGAAVSTGVDTAKRVTALVEAGVDVIVVDTAHGHSRGVIEQIRWVKRQFPHIEVIGGNIATASAARALLGAGVDGIKVGIGPGSICTTRIVAGVGVPQISAIANVAEALAGTDVPLTADGGIRYSGDIAKAIAAGAHAVMLGGLFAGTEEAPGEIELYQGRTYKAYRGMGSMSAMAQQNGSSDRYFQTNQQGSEKLVPEGIEGRVPYKGPLNAIVHQLMGGLRAAMGYTGSADISVLRTQAQFVRITAAGMAESHVHDVQITKEAPNYGVRH